jgi:hypothetical protein
VTWCYDEQRFHGGIFGVLIAVILFEGIVTFVAVPSVRPEQAPLLLLGPAVVALTSILFTLWHLDVDVTDDAVTIAFRYLWPARRIALKDSVGLEVKRIARSSTTAVRACASARPVGPSAPAGTSGSSSGFVGVFPC